MITDAFNVVFWGVVTFSILVVIHEAGHFVAARAFGLHVHEFMIGLPGPSIRFHGKKTAYGITAIPLGGYVRIAGMEPGAEDELLLPAFDEVLEAGALDAAALAKRLQIDPDRAAALLFTLQDWAAVVPAEEARGEALAAAASEFGATRTVAALSGKNVYVPKQLPGPGESSAELFARIRQGTFRGASTWKRIVILSMGVLVNLFMAILVFTIVLSTFGYYTQSLTLADVVPGGAADSAGITGGDTITSFDGEPVDDWNTLVTGIAAKRPGDRVEVGYERDGTQRTVQATIGENEDTGGPYLGVETTVEHVTLSPWAAIVESVSWTGLVFAAIVSFFNPETFSTAVEGARGVVGISIEAAEAVKNGPLDYAWLVALLSLSLGVMNILPIPPLDGGKIVLEIVEKFRGKPLNRNVVIGFSLAGALLLFSFIGYIMYADVMRYFVNT